MIPRPPAFRGELIDDPTDVDPWSGASGPFFHPPSAVARPLDADAVAILVSWAVERGVPLIPRGAGTGMPGGNVGDGVILDLRHLDEITVLDHGVVHAGAGATAAAARAAARSGGLDLPALPSSAEWCTVGGIAANDAAGARSFRYGPAHEWIEGLEVVGADAVPRTIRRGDAPDAVSADLRKRLTDMLAEPLPWPDVRKNASGYALDRFLDSGDIVDLWIGSEGTLGVITGVHLRATAAPAARGVALLGVSERSNLPGLVELAAEVEATACEWFGARLIELGGLGDDERIRGLDRRAGICLIEVVGDSSADVDARLARLVRRADPTGGIRTTSDPSRIDAFWSVRHDASPRIEALAGRSRRSTQFIEDCVVPVSALPAWLDGLERILTSHGMDAVLFGHVGDGNIHVNPLLDLTEPSWRNVARSVLDEVVELVARLGGTLSGEHGDGRLRAPFIEQIWGTEVTRAFEHVRRTLDPSGVFNPGVILPLPGQDPLEGFGAAPDFADRNRGPVRRRAAALSESA